jgi:hypothetical protein
MEMGLRNASKQTFQSINTPVIIFSPRTHPHRTTFPIYYSPRVKNIYFQTSKRTPLFMVASIASGDLLEVTQQLLIAIDPPVHSGNSAPTHEITTGGMPQRVPLGHALFLI